MQDTSQIENFDSIVTSGDYFTEVKLNLNGVDYYESDLFDLSTSYALFTDTPSVGNCYSAEIDVTMVMPNNVVIPRMAVLKPYVRLYSESGKRYVVNNGVFTSKTGSVDNEVADFTDIGTEENETLILQNQTTYMISGWLQKGVFFIDTRSVTHDSVGSDVLEIHGYDSMLKAEELYPSDDPSLYPKSDVSIVDIIANAMDVDVDDRTYSIMNKGYQINLPATYTMREILGNIASMYAGNFCITPEGKLRLVGLTDIGVDSNYLVTHLGNAIVFGTDRIIV